MKKLLSLTLCLVSLLSLASCKYETPDLSEYGIGADGRSDEVRSPYGMYDYSKRAFLSDNDPSVYKSDAYITSTLGYLQKISLLSLECDLRTATQETHAFPEAYTLCPDVAHHHDGMDWEVAKECPDKCDVFLIDAHESAGDFPIIYYSTGDYGEYNEEGIWEASKNFHLFRYDTGKVRREQIVEVKDRAIQLMTYDDMLFFVTQSAESEYELHSVRKNGKDHTSRSFGGERITLLDVYDGQIIFRDSDATIYQAAYDLESCEAVYQIEEDLTTALSVDGFDTTFTHDGYLYYCDDFETVDYQPYADRPDFVVELLSHSIRRLPLSGLSGEGELVAEKVFDDQFYGISDNIFYYAPCEPTELIEGYALNYTNGKIKAVDLETMRPIKIKEDCGIYTGAGGSYIYGDGLFATVFYVKDGYLVYDRGVGDEHGTVYFCVYDIKTGALYPLCYT